MKRLPLQIIQNMAMVVLYSLEGKEEREWERRRRRRRRVV
jgi:hypothetical protein